MNYDLSSKESMVDILRSNAEKKNVSSNIKSKINDILKSNVNYGGLEKTPYKFDEKNFTEERCI